MQPTETSHLQHVQWYVTAPYACSYLPERSARSQVAVVEPKAIAAHYNPLIREGFRRSGVFVYRPYCADCQACVPVRLKAQHFKPSRSQRRAAALLATLTVTTKPLALYPEHLDLYLRYQAARHSAEPLDKKASALKTATSSQASYTQFLLRSHVDSSLIEFRDASAALVAVSVVDWLDDGVSAVYSFFEPEYSGSLGTAAVVWMAQAAQARGLPYVYLGYWIADSPKMAYKANFKPLQKLGNQAWVDLVEG